MKKIAVLLFLLISSFSFAQKEITGKVTDDSGAGLSGVNVKEKGTNNGTISDFDGVFKFKVKEGAILVFSYVGFSKIEKNVTGLSRIDVSMSSTNNDTQLDDIVVVGSRTAPRSNTTSALPVDVLTAKDLMSTGQATFDKALQYRVPSFNTVQTPVNDATSLLDPYEIRNMGPSRTLILINGKRKNMSSLVYTQTSPGRGETGADISAIPQDAIERVEILRDGASAQYGSDAIAGVMNIILKKNATLGSTTIRSGITGKGDGEMIGVSLNNGSTVGERGFVNYTADFSKTSLANRPGILNAQDEADYWGAPLAQTTAFLKLKPDGGNVNGAPETAAAKFLVNGGVNYSPETQFYYNAAYVYKKVNSFANYRAPYWRSASDMPYLSSLYGNGTAASYVGYVPTFIGDLNDYNATIGYKSTKNGWNTDVSFTTGGNSQTYTVTNSQNRSKDAAGNFIYAADPNRYTGQTTFKPGGTSFKHYVGNIDMNKNLTDKLSFGIGSEFRSETFEVLEGDVASYTGLGADSFQGNTPENSGKFNRYNIGGYVSLSYDVTKDLLVEGTGRVENYSDFGSTTIGKLSARYKTFDDKLTFRGSISSGFRAPSLHQIYTEKSQSTFQGGTIQVTGIVNNVSTAARTNGVPQLTAEKSTNFTLGTGFKASKNLSITLDYYRIGVKDRIVLGNLVSFEAGRKSQDPLSPNYNVYEGKNPQAFFVNGVNSITSGIDFVASYRNIQLGSGKLAFNFAGNYTIENKIDGAVNNPQSVKNLGTAAAPIYSGQTALTSGQNPVLKGQTVFNQTQDYLMFTSRPQFKFIEGVEYEMNDILLTLNNTTFGPTKFKQADFSNPGLTTEFLTAQVTDLGVVFDATEKFSIAFNINNIFNVKPKYKITADTASAQAIINNPVLLKTEISNITFNGRYDMVTYDGSHFSQLGTMFNLSFNYKF